MSLLSLLIDMAAAESALDYREIKDSDTVDIIQRRAAAFVYARVEYQGERICVS